MLTRGVDLRNLIRLGKEKDPGLDEYYLAGTMRQIVLVNPETLPKTLEPIGIETLQQFFLQLADKVAAGEYSE